MAAKFKVGDIVVCTAIQANTQGKPYWSAGHTALLHKPKKVVQFFTQHFGNIWYILENTTLIYWDESWLTLANPNVLPVQTPLTIPKCNCLISAGCKCGVFRKEMEAKGKIYNAVLGFWTPKNG